MKKRTEAVDIIIPVYNGYDDLQLCMPSVLKHTDLTKHRLDSSSTTVTLTSSFCALANNGRIATNNKINVFFIFIICLLTIVCLLYI